MCMSVKYCIAKCQRNHWPKHKKECKLQAAELRDEALFKDPPAKEDCPICFLPMPEHLICCVSLPPATISSVPIYDFAIANEEFANKASTEVYHDCCGNSICKGCVHSCIQSGNNDKCPFCNSEQGGKTNRYIDEEIRKRVEANDAGAMCLLVNHYLDGRGGLQQDHARAMELYDRAADLVFSKAHCFRAPNHYQGGELKKAKFQRPWLWQDMKQQDAILEQWRQTPEIWSKL